MPSYSGSTSQLSRGYTSSDTSVHWRTHSLEGVDPLTFVEYASVWGADSRTVFTEWRPRRIDRSTFQYLNPVFVRDAKGVYDYHGEIEGADAETFECLDSGVCSDDGALFNRTWFRGFGRDSERVYYHDQMTGTASALRGADPTTFRSLGNRYGLDGANVYFEKGRLAGCKPMSWVHLGRGYSTDGRGIYYQNRRLEGLSLDSFKVVMVPGLSGNYAFDGKVFMRNDTAITASEFDKELNSAIAALKGSYETARRNHLYVPGQCS